MTYQRRNPAVGAFIGLAFLALACCGVFALLAAWGGTEGLDTPGSCGAVDKLACEG